MPPIGDEGQSFDDLAGLLDGKPTGNAAEDNEEAGAPDEGQEHTEEHTEPEGDEQDTGNEDDSTDPEPDPEGEDGEEAESDTSDPEPLYAVTLDGKEERVTLKEALAGYQRNADYTRKTQEVAENRKALDAAAAEARAQRDQYSQILKVLQERIGPAEGERTEAQWAELRNANPAAYATEWADSQRRQVARTSIKAEQDRIAGEQQGEAVTRFKAVVDDQRTKLLAALPALKDPVKGKEALATLRKYAVESAGFSEEEVDKAYDHRVLVALDKARQWDAHQAALKAAKGKLKDAREVPPPSARQPQTKPGKTAQRVAQQKKFDRSGRIDDAVDLI